MYPYVLGETIALPFVVFNNKDSDLDVDVTLYNTNQEFDFPQVDGKSQPKPSKHLHYWTKWQLYPYSEHFHF